MNSYLPPSMLSRVNVSYMPAVFITASGLGRYVLSMWITVEREPGITRCVITVLLNAGQTMQQLVRRFLK